MLSITDILKEEMWDKLGFDLDLHHEKEYYPRWIKIYSLFYNLKNTFPDAEIRIYMSSSEKGYHFEIVGESIGKLTDREKWNIRESLGDCKGRLLYSQIRGYDDILFESKIQNGKLKDRRRISKEILLS